MQIQMLYNIGDIMYSSEQLNLVEEICCKVCNEVIHNHIDCPVCNEKFSDTDAFCNIREKNIGFIMKCEKCNTEFELISKNQDLIFKVITDKISTD